jgi:DCN1-like protein 1/2
LPSSREIFTKVYIHTFQLAKTGNQKAIPLEMAVAYWELLFQSPLSAVNWNTDSTPWSTWWIEFLNTKYNRSVNKDVWNQTLKFAQQSLEDEEMSFWSEEASWPSVIDQFVEYVKKDKRGGGEVEAMEE